MRTCTCERCGKEFVAQRKAKACSSKCRNWLYIQKNHETAKLWSKKSYHRRKTDPNNIKLYLFKYAKARSERKNLPFNITLEDIVLPKICPILGVPLSKDSFKYCYSIDRIVPDLGYVKGNIQVISRLANCMKWDSNREERLAFANWVLSSEGG